MKVTLKSKLIGVARSIIANFKPTYSILDAGGIFLNILS